LRHLLHILAPIARKALIAALFCALPLSAAQAADINYTTDTRIVAKACLAHLAGKPPESSVAKAGFSVFMKNKRGITFRKNASGVFLPTYFIYGAMHKRNDPTNRKCALMISLPKRLMVELQSPEFHDFITALRGVMKAGGYKPGTAKNAFGRDEETWTGRGGTYAFSIAVQSSVIMLDIIPK
jgi:hypothetical protein